MNRLFIAISMFLASAVMCRAQEHDTIRVEKLEEVVVSGVRVSKDTPFTVTDIDKNKLGDFSKSTKELPHLFAQTPGVVAWSENGIGTGTTYMRIRGAGDSRINVTLDGIQLNSPEDQCVFWANMNSYSSMLGNVQIQRGVGTSTDGDGAFGGNVVLATKAPSLIPTFEVNASYGSFNTFNAGGSFSSGMLFKHLVIDGAYHHTGTNGFMHGTSGNSGSYMGGLSWYGKNFILRYKNIGNYEHTGQAWNGVDTGNLLDGNYGINTGLNSYKDFWNAGLGQYNNLYEHLNDPYDPSKGTSRYVMNDGTLWPKTTDNFIQNRNILSFVTDFNDSWKLAASLHYSYGSGYYNEFKYDYKLKKFGISDFITASGDTLTKTDFVRRKGLTQHTYGGVVNVHYNDVHRELIAGISGQGFNGNHYGYLDYVANQEMSQIYKGRKYYDSDARKGDFNVHAKGTYRWDSGISAYADLQYRHVGYKTWGLNDKFYEKDGVYVNQILNVDEKYNFFNPKAGVNFKKNDHRVYASVAMSHREPSRNNFTDNGSYPFPKPEELVDTELGYSLEKEKWNVSVNGYYMKYNNQLVQTGEVSDIGEPLTTNVKDSYRLGVEMTAGVTLSDCLDIYGNAALSRNKVKDFDEVVDDWDTGGTRTIHYDNSTLAMSPSAIINGFVTFRRWGLVATWHTNFVSKQYLDNTQCEQRSLPSYSQSNFSASYTFDMKKRCGWMREIVIAASVNNIFNSHYAASGWVYSAICESCGHDNDNRYRQIGYMPVAGTNFMCNLTLKF